ncbi:MAG: metallophosphoesterase [Phycisphaerales bacterium]|nr:metallophosphoesterase [Phycisphaerales bacterium]
MRRTRPRPGHHVRLLEALEGLAVDVVVLTGDFMNHPGDEGTALAALGELSRGWTCRVGAFAVGGNHDTAGFLRAAKSIPGIRWLDHEAVDVTARGMRLRMVGSAFPEDLLRATERMGETAADLTLTLVHYPTEIYTAARLGLPLAFCGHTHGGQVRPSAAWVPHTSCDLPSNLASGMLRLGDTLMCVSRGLGTAVMPLRLNCEAQVPLYVLRRGELSGERPDRVVAVKRW